LLENGIKLSSSFLGVDERELALGAIRDKYQRLLVNIEALKNTLAEEVPVLDEKTLKEAVDRMFEMAVEIARDLREFEID
jgi:hypothetical protein